MKETKSARLFRHAFNEAVDAIETWGAGKIDALASLHDDTDEVIYQRTVNDIRKCAAKKARMIDFNARRGEDVTVATEALAIVLKTCDDWERDMKAFYAMVRGE